MSFESDDRVILIDDRAGSIDLADTPALRGQHVLTRLDSADVCWQGNGPEGAALIGIEVKTVSDLLQSSSNGRLQARQLPAMMRDYSYSWLLYYGEWRAGGQGQIEYRKEGDRYWRAYRQGKRELPAAYIDSFLMTVQMSGVRVQHCQSLNAAAEWLACAARWWAKPWSAHRGMQTFDNSRELAHSLMPGMDDGMMLRARVAAQLPGVGYQRACQVARHFPSVRAMVAAQRAEWQKVEGVGKVIAATVDEAMD